MPPYVMVSESERLVIRAPESERADRNAIAAHASAVRGVIDASDSRPVLVYPALNRWTPLDGPELQELGDDDFLVGLAERVAA